MIIACNRNARAAFSDVCYLEKADEILVVQPDAYLPDDFRERHRSVWIDMPNTLHDPKKGHHVHHTYVYQLEYGETRGFSGFGCNEHHQNGYRLMPSSNLIAATLSRRASRAALGSLKLHEVRPLV